MKPDFTPFEFAVCQPPSLVNSFHGELWKRIYYVGFSRQPEYYISSFGRLASKSGILAGSVINGYRSLNVRIPTDGKDYKLASVVFYVHKLVAAYFVPRLDPDQNCVIHLDFDKFNNLHTNLNHATRVESIEHNRYNPACIKRVGRRRIGNYKLTESKVRIIKTLLKNDNIRLNMIARQFGITHTQLNRIRSGENWKHVTI
ncbi:hypothetical protein [Dyadobacter sp. Leaf189]|uniref:hypothetical protein n=1 Tax=Dyadobacter sp. Leaf189 TaxID=1736295 RepID=UPI0006F3A03D|nr:hypothetical protein [Dyadobacter sp. Leaf189]KQS33955.1 hypothetical protein ASG33_07960 [Dyadobacter sp. Leaf189]